MLEQYPLLSHEDGEHPSTIHKDVRPSLSNKDGRGVAITDLTMYNGFGNFHDDGVAYSAHIQHSVLSQALQELILHLQAAPCEHAAEQEHKQKPKSSSGLLEATARGRPQIIMAAQKCMLHVQQELCLY